jgi:hypothetical protein
VVKDTNEKPLDFAERNEKIRAIEDRIAQTDSGLRFLDRIREIGRPRPLRDDQEQGE